MKRYLKALAIAGMIFPFIHMLANMTRLIPGYGGELAIFPVALMIAFYTEKNNG